MAVERNELQLVWPPALFAAAEVRALLAADADDDTLGGLLAEAWHDGGAQRLLQQVARLLRIWPGQLARGVSQYCGVESL